MERQSHRPARWILRAVLLGLVLFGPGTFQLTRLAMMERRLDRKLEELSATHERLKEEEQKLQSDPTYVEGLIRSTFKVAKPGEYVIPLTPDEQRNQ